MDPDDAATPYDRHGSDDLHRVDLRSFASARGEGEGRSSADAQSDCGSEEEERSHRCRQDRRLLTLRLPARVPHGINGDPRPAPHVALSQPGGQADGADEEPCLLMETGVNYNKQRLHKVGYFKELMTTNQDVHESIRPLLKLSREMISRSQKLDYALISSLERDPLLKERLRRLRTVPGVGPITALTWALEIGDFTRFTSNKQAISYCGLCGDEKSSADKIMRMPISKQRNKHIQRVLIEAAKLATRESPELAMIRARELERGNPNRATLAVARKMVTYMLAVERRQQDWVPAEQFNRTEAA